MTDRRYRQQGYKDRALEKRDPPRPAPTDVPRGGPMIGKRALSRCASCGAVLPIATASLEQCPSCQAAMHACRQCTHFQPGRRFECAQPIPERIADKNARNECAEFSLRVAVEADVTRPDDAQRTFRSLFKK